jgi:hypothetical protein
MHYSAIDCAKLLRSIVDVADPQEAVPFATILAAYAYEAGDLDSVAKSLSFAYSADPSYSLTKLLMRVTASGWPKEAFIKMREELHLKVMATCYGPEGDEVINPVGAADVLTSKPINLSGLMNDSAVFISFFVPFFNNTVNSIILSFNCLRKYT